MISHCLWQIYIRLCSFHFFWHRLTTFTFTHLQDSYHDISRDCVIRILFRRHLSKFLTEVANIFKIYYFSSLSSIYLPSASFFNIIIIIRFLLEKHLGKFLVVLNLIVKTFEQISCGWDYPKSLPEAGTQIPCLAGNPNLTFLHPRPFLPIHFCHTTLVLKIKVYTSSYIVFQS